MNIPQAWFPYVLQGFMLLVAILFVLNISIKKLSNRGILILFTLGVLIFLGYIFRVMRK